MSYLVSYASSEYWSLCSTQSLQWDGVLAQGARPVHRLPLNQSRLNPPGLDSALALARAKREERVWMIVRLDHPYGDNLLGRVFRFYNLPTFCLNAAFWAPAMRAGAGESPKAGSPGPNPPDANKQ